MATARPQTTTMSTKGQVVLPHAVRTARHWSAGTKLIVEDTPNGVLLRAAPLFPPTTVDEVFGSARYTGPTITLEEMDAGVLAEARQRHARDRY